MTRTGRIATPATKIGNPMRCTARSGFEAGRFKGMPVHDRRYAVVDTDWSELHSACPHLKKSQNVDREPMLQSKIEDDSCLS
jgi:hypothetical protein